MSLIAGTVVFTRNDQSYFLVTDEVPTPRFYTVKMHKHDGDTALGSLLTGMKDELGFDIDNLRLGELAAWHGQGLETAEDLISLYTFEPVDAARFNMVRLGMLGLQFMNAKDAADLLRNVDMTGVARLD